MLDKQQTLINAIYHLPCFNKQAIEITPIDVGLSHFCFHVHQIHTGNPTQTAISNKNVQHYFVKYLVKDNVEASSERIVAELAADLGIAPKVLYRSESWLVTEFIDGCLLSQIPMEDTEKVDVAIRCLSQCHQLKPESDIPSLSISTIVSRQLNQVLEHNKSVNHHLAKELTLLCQQVVSFAEVGEKVLCHGDVNFSNILIDHQQKPWLIDFECAFIGFREFDLAMLIAINQLPLDSCPDIIKRYQDESSQTIDNRLVQRYLACCYLINALWFFHHAENVSPSKDEQPKDALHKAHLQKNYQQLAQQQCKLFEQLNNTPVPLSTLLFA